MRVLRIVSVIEYRFLDIVSPPVTKTGYVLPHAGTPIRPAAPAGTVRLLYLRRITIQKPFARVKAYPEFVFRYM